MSKFKQHLEISSPVINKQHEQQQDRDRINVDFKKINKDYFSKITKF